MMSDRPRIKIEPTPTDIVVEIAALVGVAFGLWAVAEAWPRLPGVIPTHFGFAGKPDGWGSKSSLWMLPVLGAVSYLLITIATRFPHTFNYPVPITEENAERQYRIAVTAMRWLKLEVVWICSYVAWAAIQVALHKAKALSPLFTIVVLAAIGITTGVLIVRSYKAR